MWYVYVVECKNGKYYVGMTKDLENRIKERNSGETKSLKGKTPVKMSGYKEYKTYTEARKKELWLKKMKSRKIIEEFVL